MAYHNKKEQLLITLDSINKSVYNKKYLEVFRCLPLIILLFIVRKLRINKFTLSKTLDN